MVLHDDEELVVVASGVAREVGRGNRLSRLYGRIYKCTNNIHYNASYV